MTCANLKQIYQTGIKIIDLRAKEDYDNGHIPTSINIPHTELIINHDKYLCPNKQYYLICDEGNVSQNVIIMLAKFPYQLINIIDGFEAWDGPIESNKQ